MHSFNCCLDWLPRKHALCSKEKLLKFTSRSLLELVILELSAGRVSGCGMIHAYVLIYLVLILIKRQNWSVWNHILFPLFSSCSICFVFYHVGCARIFPQSKCRVVIKVRSEMFSHRRWSGPLSYMAYGRASYASTRCNVVCCKSNWAISSPTSNLATDGMTIKQHPLFTYMTPYIYTHVDSPPHYILASGGAVSTRNNGRN
jgi:hypothetical protein